MTDVWNTALIESEHSRILETRRVLLRALQRFESREITGQYRGAQEIVTAPENDMLWALEQMTHEEIADVITGLADAFLERDDD